MYLPLDILHSATNIRQLFSHTTNLDALVRKVHTQMPSKRWAPELNRLRFVDTTSDVEKNEEASKNSDDKPKPRTTRSASLKATVMGAPKSSDDKPKPKRRTSASLKATAIEKSLRLEPAKEKRLTRQMRKRKVN